MKKNQSRAGVCKVENCGEPIKARLLCEMHYARMRRSGKLEATNKSINVKVDTCLVIGCTNSNYHQGLCSTHTSYKQKFSTPYLPKVIKLCGVKDCTEKHWGKGLCELHFREWRKIKHQHGLD